MASTFAKRFKFHRTNTETGSTHGSAMEMPTVTSSSGNSDDDKKNGEAIEKDRAYSTAGEMPQPDTEQGANSTLKDLQRKHMWDPNFPAETREGIEEAEMAHDMQQELNLVGGMTDNSPYPEVRAAVRNVGGPGIGSSKVVLTTLPVR